MKFNKRFKNWEDRKQLFKISSCAYSNMHLWNRTWKSIFKKKIEVKIILKINKIY